MIEEQKLLVLQIINDFGLLETLDDKTLIFKEGVNPDTLPTVTNELAESNLIRKTAAGHRITQHGKDFLLRHQLKEPVNVPVLEITQEKIIAYLKKGTLAKGKSTGHEYDCMFDFLVKKGLMTVVHSGAALINNEGQSFIRNSNYFNPVPLSVFDWKMNIIDQLKGGQAILNGDGDLQEQAISELKQDGIIEQVGTTYLKTLTSKGREYIGSGLSYNDFLYNRHKPIVSKTYNFHGAVQPIIGDNNQSAIIAETITTNPTTNNATPKTSTMKKILVGVIIAVIGGLILWLLTK